LGIGGGAERDEREGREKAGRDVKKKIGMERGKEGWEGNGKPERMEREGERRWGNGKEGSTWIFVQGPLSS